MVWLGRPVDWLHAYASTDDGLGSLLLLRLPSCRRRLRLVCPAAWQGSAGLPSPAELDCPMPPGRQAQDDESGVLNVSPAANTLNLVLRDEGLMRFVKYLSAAAPSSRFDIALTYQPEPDSEDEEGGEEQE